MTKEEFKAEIHTYLDVAYNEFIEYNKVVIEIFNEFHRVCQRNNIIYYSAFGTLLALTRDNSLIVPWDKDCDVLLPINQRDSLIEALYRDLNDCYYFDSIDTNNKFRLMMLRVGKKGYNLDTFHLDVFYLVGAPDSKSEQEIMKNEIRSMLSLHERKASFSSQKIFVRLNGKPHIYLTAIWCKLNTLFANPIKQYKQICNRYPFENAKNYITIEDGAKVFPKEIFEPRHTVNVNEASCCIPGNPKKFLTIQYKDYSKYFPISARFDEFYMGYKDLKESCDKKRPDAPRDFIL